MFCPLRSKLSKQLTIIYVISGTPAVYCGYTCLILHYLGLFIVAKIIMQIRLLQVSEFEDVVDVKKLSFIDDGVLIDWKWTLKGRQCKSNRSRV